MTTIPEDGQLVRIGGHQLQVHIRPGHTGTTPLLLCGGIGTSYQALQPLVDAIDSSIEIIRVDVPGVGGSPPAPLPLGFRTWRGCSGSYSMTWATGRSTSWAIPGVVVWRSSSPCSTGPVPPVGPDQHQHRGGVRPRCSTNSGHRADPAAVR